MSHHTKVLGIGIVMAVLLLAAGCFHQLKVLPLHGSEVFYGGGELVADADEGLEMAAAFTGRSTSAFHFYLEFRNNTDRPLILDPDHFYACYANTPEDLAQVPDPSQLCENPEALGVRCVQTYHRYMKTEKVHTARPTHLGLVDRVHGPGGGSALEGEEDSQVQIGPLRKITLRPGEQIGGKVGFKSLNAGTTLLLVMPVDGHLVQAQYLLTGAKRDQVKTATGDALGI